MRTHRLTLAAVSVLMVATGCGTDDGGAEDGTSGATSRATEVGFPCTAVTDEVLDAVDTALREAGYTSPAGRVAVGLLEGSEHVVGCTIVPDFLYAGVLGFDRQVPLTDHLDAYGGTSPEPVTGLGDEAFAATNSYDGTRLVARSGDRVVLVDSRFAGEAVPRDVLETLAEALLAADDDVPPIDLPEECPSIDDEHLAAELDEVVLARGQLREDGSLTCAYASADSHVRLHAVNADEASLMMMQADETGEPEDLDGDPAYVDDDRVSVVVGDRCLVGVLTSPMGWAPADPRSEQQTAAALLDLARWVRDDIGCPGLILPAVVPAVPRLGRMQVVAHRGASEENAEHTLGAYLAALDAGADGLECDVRLTADGHLVCVHDRNLRRTAASAGTVSTMELKDLSELDIASWKNPWADLDDEAPDTDPELGRVLTLRKLLETVADCDRRVELAIETKHPTRYGGLVERRLVQLLTEFGWAGKDSPVRVMSFSFTALQRVSRLAPQLELVMLLDKAHHWPMLRRMVEPGWIIGPGIKDLRDHPGLGRHLGGRRVFVWTVNSQADLELCQSLGVEAVITDRPAYLLERLGR